MELIEITKVAVMETFNSFANALPGIIGALFLLIIGYFIAKIIARIVRKALEMAKVDTLADKLQDIEMVRRSGINIVPSVIISKVVYYMVFLVFVIAAAGALGIDEITILINELVAYIPKLLVAALILAIGLWFANFIKDILKTALDSMGVSGSGIISNIVFYFLFINIALSALGQADIDMSFLNNNLTMILGGAVLAFAIGYGFASRDIMANLLGGLYSRNKFQRGDVISVNGTKGQVVNIDATSLTLQSENNTRVVVPLGHLSDSSVEKF